MSRFGQRGLYQAHGSAHHQPAAGYQRCEQGTLLRHVIYQMRSHAVHVYVLLKRGHVVRLHGGGGGH